MNNKIFIILVLITISIVNLNAQESADLNGFLHINKNYFIPGETLHFKAYFQQDLMEDRVLSILIYQIINQNPDSLIVRHRIKVNAKESSGAIKIPSGVPSGNYLFTSFIEQKGISFYGYSNPGKFQ
jgi:hypothetical protein